MELNDGNKSRTEQNDVSKSREQNLVLRRIIYFIIGILEALFAFRLVFKLLGASPESAFVSFIYSITGVFLAPFSGIFSPATTTGLETTSVLEPATIIAMVVYALVGYGIIRLIEILKRQRN